MSRQWEIRVTSIRIMVTLFMVLCIGSAVYAGSVPNTFTSGTTAKSSEVNANFSYLAARIVPPGAVMAFAGTTPPEGWLLCDGSEVSRTTYADLFASISIAHGGGDGVNTFNLPDYRGTFLRGVDSGTGRDPDAASRAIMNTGGNEGDSVGSIQTEDFKSHTHHTHFNQGGWIYPGTGGNGFLSIYGYGNTWNYFNDTNDLPTQPTGGNETRPVNAYVNWIIKY